jgi:phosphoribosylaminoimidazolecarboxamide formyltransferase / IMP cyclohydrolase
MNNHPVKITRALLSVSDKTGIIELGHALSDAGVEILSTGGTAKALSDAGIEITKVSDVTQFPEIMGGRVKSLHPKIHGGILGKRDDHATEAQEHGIGWIDLVVCNLYPFAKTIAGDCTFDKAIENIDIGGPAMIRAAAKNVSWVTSCVSPSDYNPLIAAITTGSIPAELRKTLSAKAFAHTAEYDSMIANYLSKGAPVSSTRMTGLDAEDRLSLRYTKHSDLRYGENPHQTASVYRNTSEASPLLDAIQHQGKPLSYNNYNDTQAAIDCLREFHQPACVVVKHANPCGVAIASNIDVAFDKAWAADSLSAFGGIVALNEPVTEKIATFLSGVFIEVLIAPSISETALAIFEKKPNLRILTTDLSPCTLDGKTYKAIEGGLLVQDADAQTLDFDTCRTVTQAAPTTSEADQLLAWIVVKHLKSNAIAIIKDGVTLGLGCGQVSRVDAVKQALSKAGDVPRGATLASDAFFPFTDNIDLMAGSCVSTIVQPGGSVKDKSVIEACDINEIAMILTGHRCFNH